MSQLFEIQAVDTTTINAPADDVTLTELQSGTLFICTKDPANDRHIFLPNPTTAGLYYRFQMTNAAAVAQLLVIASPTADTLVGYWKDSTGAKTKTADPSGEQTIEFTGTAVSADWIEVVSDGTNWNVIGEDAVATNDGIAIG